MTHWGPKLAAALYILRKDGCRSNLKKVLYGDKKHECLVERIGRKAKLFGEKLNVEGAPTQCSPQEENCSKKQETQTQSTGNGAKESREGVEGAPPQSSPQEENGSKKRETQPQSTPHKGNGARENREGVEGAPPQCSPQEENGSKKRQGAQGGALLNNLTAITVGQTVLDMGLKGVGQAISIHDKSLEEAAKTVWDSVTGLDAAKLISTANTTAQVTKMTRAEVKGLKEALDELIEVKNDLRKELMEVKNELREARNELMGVKNDVKEVKALVGPPKPPSSGGGGGGGSGSGGDDEDGGDGNGWD